MSFYSVAPFIKEFYPEYYSIESYPAKDCVRIHKVAEEWGIFSNFAKTPLVVNGVTFDSAEELAKAPKFAGEGGDGNVIVGIPFYYTGKDADGNGRLQIRNLTVNFDKKA